MSVSKTIPLSCKKCGETPSIGKCNGEETIGHSCEYDCCDPVDWWQGTIEEWNKKQKLAQLETSSVAINKVRGPYLIKRVCNCGGAEESIGLNENCSLGPWCYSCAKGLKF